MKPTNRPPNQSLTANADSRHRALALAAQHGHVDVVRLLLDAGEDPNRYNPDGNHSHSTPLHPALVDRNIYVRTENHLYAFGK